MVIAGFQVQDKLRRARFFQKTFLVADTSMEVVLRILFFILSNANVGFLDRKLTWRTYSVAKALSTTKKVQIIDQKKFAKAALDPKKKTFMMHITTITLGRTIHPKHEAQIVLLKAEKTPVLILAEYLDFVDVFSKELAVVLSEYTEINTHAIDLEKGKQLLYTPIYSLGLVELEILKTYIETHLKTGFIQPFKFFASALILFDKKPNSSFFLFVDY